MLFLGEGRRRVEAGKEGLAPIQLLLLPLLLAVNAVAMDCSRCCKRISRAPKIFPVSGSPCGTHVVAQLPLVVVVKR